MKLKRVLFGAVAASALLVASAASAAVTVSIYHTDPGVAAALGNATLARASGMVADATVNVAGGIDFTNAPGNNSDAFTIAQFLHNPAGLSAAVGNLTLDNTYFYITGQIFLNAGVNNFIINHDDGLQLNITGLASPLVVNAPGPTPPIDTNFSATAASAGVYNFQLSYAECCGGPARLLWAYPDGRSVDSGIPEPGAWALMLAGFGGLGSILRRRRALAVV